MCNSDMIAAILNKIQSDDTLIIVLRAAITKAIYKLSTEDLQTIMALLGLPFN